MATIVDIDELLKKYDGVYWMLNKQDDRQVNLWILKQEHIERVDTLQRKFKISGEIPILKWDNDKCYFVDHRNSKIIVTQISSVVQNKDIFINHKEILQILKELYPGSLHGDDFMVGLKHFLGDICDVQPPTPPEPKQTLNDILADW